MKVVVFLLTCFATSLLSQNDFTPEILTSTESESSDIPELLVQFQNNPLDINNATEEELKDLPLLTPIHVDSILKLRPFRRKSELKNLLGNAIYDLIHTFIVLRTTTNYPQIFATQRFKLALPRSRGYLDRKFLGSPLESMSRLRIKLNENIDSGILLQKDPGEISYYDHYSAFLSWQSFSIPLTITSGDYIIHCGEGLLLSLPYSFNKAASTTNPLIYRMAYLKSYLSSNEYDGLRGFAFNFGTDRGLRIISFYSSTYRDGQLNENSTAVLQLDRSGYHRTRSEILKQNQVREKSWGIILKSPVFLASQIGLTFIKTRFSPGFTVLSPLETRRDFYRLQGQEVKNLSFYYAISIDQLFLHGELSPLSSGLFAQKHTAELNSKIWGTTLRFSHIPAGFQSPLGRAYFSSNPFPGSLSQFFAGIWFKFKNKLKISGYWHIEKDLWRSYFYHMPKFLKSAYLQSEFPLRPYFNLIVHYRHTLNLENINISKNAIWKSSHRFRIQIDKRINTNVRIRSRIEHHILTYSQYFSKKQGNSFFQSISVKLLYNIYLFLQLTYFDTPDYETRIYEYERGLPGAFSNYPLYGFGNKYYILLQTKIFNRIKIWLKYRRINFDGIDQIGSGNSAIMGNTRQDLEMQIEYKF